jgi:hypothetical protein
LNGTGKFVGPEDYVAYPWDEGNDRVARQFRGLQSVVVHQRAELLGNFKYCILTYSRDWCNGEPTTRTELDVSYDRRSYHTVPHIDANNVKTDPTSTWTPKP